MKKKHIIHFNIDDDCKRTVTKELEVLVFPFTAQQLTTLVKIHQGLPK